MRWLHVSFDLFHRTQRKRGGRKRFVLAFVVECLSVHVHCCSVHEHVHVYIRRIESCIIWSLLYDCTYVCNLRCTMTSLRWEDDAAATVSLPMLGQLLRSPCQGLLLCTSKHWSMQMAGRPRLVVYVLVYVHWLWQLRWRNAPVTIIVTKTGVIFQDESSIVIPKLQLLHYPHNLQRSQTGRCL